MERSWTSTNKGRGISDRLRYEEDAMDHSKSNEKKQISKKIKHRRYRMAFTTDQINHLESVFKRGPYVNSTQRQEIAETIGLSDRCVKVWFQNRRMREKSLAKEKAEDEEMKQEKPVVEVGLRNQAMKEKQLAKKQEDDVQMKQGKAVVSCPETVKKQKTSETSIPIPCHTTILNASSAPNINPVQEEVSKTDNSFRPNYYQDISPARDQPTTPIRQPKRPPTVLPYFNSVSPDYKASAEFSIDLCKKYKSMINGPEKDRTIISSDCIKSEQTNSNGVKRKMESPKLELQDVPEDLSMKKVNTTKNQVPSSKTNTPDNIGVPPIYVNFPQPFTDGNMMWNQLTIPSFIPAVPAASISILPSEPTPAPTAYFVQKDSCNCCKCPKNSVHHQNPTSNQNYIINVVPYQNFHKY